MTREAERICELAQESAAAEDPEAALRALAELRHEVDAFVRVCAGRALSAGRSFSDVARALGISRQAAHRRFRDLAPERRTPDRDRPLVATEEARHVLRLAGAEAQAAGTRPGSEHVLLGILRTDTEAARALRYEGATPERVRAQVRSQTTAEPRPSSVRRIVTQAAQAALSRGDDEVDVQQLLLAALEDPDGRARSTLKALAIPPAALRKRRRRRPVRPAATVPR